MTAIVRASDALTGLREHHLLAPGAGAIILIAWAGVLAVLGIALSVPQDINRAWRRAPENDGARCGLSGDIVTLWQYLVRRLSGVAVS
jgi:hypothetical protein